MADNCLQRDVNGGKIVRKGRTLPARATPKPGEVWGGFDTSLWRLVVPHSIEVCDAVAYRLFGSSRSYQVPSDVWDEWVSEIDARPIAKIVEKL